MFITRAQILKPGSWPHNWCYIFIQSAFIWTGGADRNENRCGATSILSSLELSLELSFKLSLELFSRDSSFP